MAVETSLSKLPRVLIAGGQRWPDSGFAPVATRLMALPRPSTFVIDDSDGVTRIADFVGRRLGHRVETHVGDWRTNPSGAARARDLEMFDAHDGPDLVLCFASSIDTDLHTRSIAIEAFERCIATEIHQLMAPIQRHYFPPLVRELA